MKSQLLLLPVFLVSASTNQLLIGGSSLSISKDAKCSNNGRTCKGSTFGNCCSRYNWCGTTSSYCGTGCQSNFGLCTSSAIVPSIKPLAIVPVSKKPIASSITTIKKPATTPKAVSAAPSSIGGGGGGGGGPNTSKVSFMPSQFKGLNSGIGSWFRADNTGDSTNGHSWCGYPYSDSSNGFAPSLALMSNNSNAVYGNAWTLAGTQYCGLEALVTNPNSGAKKLMYIIDSFAAPWVRTPQSIDIMTGSWSLLTGIPATDKNTVIQGVEWQLTGYRSNKYCFKCSGDPQG